jgi:hypothetical protein
MSEWSVQKDGVYKLPLGHGFYTFTITIGAWGKNADSAWNDAVESFSFDPGNAPDSFEFEPDENEETEENNRED